MSTVAAAELMTPPQKKKKPHENQHCNSNSPITLSDIWAQEKHDTCCSSLLNKGQKLKLVLLAAVTRIVSQPRALTSVKKNTITCRDQK